MNTKVLKLLAGVAWVGLAMASASPANAIAFTKQGGDYAACSANADLDPREFCLMSTSYHQTIRFMSTSCGAGGNCQDTFSAVYVDTVFSAGRKQAWFQDTCTVYNVFELGPCAC